MCVFLKEKKRNVCHVRPLFFLYKKHGSFHVFYKKYSEIYTMKNVFEPCGVSYLNQKKGWVPVSSTGKVYDD